MRWPLVVISLALAAPAAGQIEDRWLQQGARAVDELLCLQGASAQDRASLPLAIFSDAQGNLEAVSLAPDTAAKRLFTLRFIAYFADRVGDPQLSSEIAEDIVALLPAADAAPAKRDPALPEVLAAQVRRCAIATALRDAIELDRRDAMMELAAVVAAQYDKAPVGPDAEDWPLVRAMRELSLLRRSTLQELGRAAAAPPRGRADPAKALVTAARARARVLQGAPPLRAARLLAAAAQLTLAQGDAAGALALVKESNELERGETAAELRWRNFPAQYDALKATSGARAAADLARALEKDAPWPGALADAEVVYAVHLRRAEVLAATDAKAAVELWKVGWSALLLGGTSSVAFYRRAFTESYPYRSGIRERDLDKMLDGSASGGARIESSVAQRLAWDFAKDRITHTLEHPDDDIMKDARSQLAFVDDVDGELSLLSRLDRAQRAAPSARDVSGARRAQVAALSFGLLQVRSRHRIAAATAYRAAGSAGLDLERAVDASERDRGGGTDTPAKMAEKRFMMQIMPSRYFRNLWVRLHRYIVAHPVETAQPPTDTARRFTGVVPPPERPSDRARVQRPPPYRPPPRPGEDVTRDTYDKLKFTFIRSTIWNARTQLAGTSLAAPSRKRAHKPRTSDAESTESPRPAANAAREQLWQAFEFKPRKLEEFQALLTDGDALIAFAPGEHGLFSWAVTRSGIAFERADVDAATVSDLVRRVRASLAAREIPGRLEVAPFDAAAAYDLYRVTLGRVRDRVRDKTHLYWFAAGDLATLPPALLVEERPAEERARSAAQLRGLHWLVDRYAISVVPDLSLLSLQRTGRDTAGGPGRSFLGVGATLLSAEELGGVQRARSEQLAGGGDARCLEGKALNALAKLAETADELRTLQSLFDPARAVLLLGPSATKAAVQRELAAGAAVVSFATHGFTAGEVCGRFEPALLLADPAGELGAGERVLFSSEVAATKVDADLVLLSACNTATSDGRPRGETFTGLTTSFAVAGARAQLVSHWPVASGAAREISVNTVKRSRTEHLPIAESLRRTMIELRDGASGDLQAHPFYWAPFVLVGDGARAIP